MQKFLGLGLTTLLFIFAAPAEAKKGPQNKTEYLFNACKQALKDDGRFDDSFCKGYIGGYLSGYGSGSMYMFSTLPTEQKNKNTKAPAFGFCLENRVSEIDIAKRFVQWSAKITDKHEKDSYLASQTSEGFLSFLTISYKCNQ